MKEIAWDKVSQFKGPEKSPGFLLWQVSIKWRRQIEAALATIGLTHPQFVLLASIGWLTRNNQPVTQIELARHCGTDATMTSQILRTLEKRELIERIQLDGNERAKYPRLTQAGRDLVAQAVPLVESVDQHFFKKLGSDLSKYIAILQKLS